MRITWLVLGLCLLQLALCGSASLPTDAKAIELDQRVEDYAPGAYYKVYVAAPGTLAVMLEELPAEMQTRINIIDEANNWLADQQTTNPGQTVTVEARAEAPGWYYIGVMDLQGKSHDTPYAFRVAMR